MTITNLIFGFIPEINQFIYCIKFKALNPNDYQTGIFENACMQ